MFSTLPKAYFNFWVASILLSAISLNLDQSKISLFGKGLNLDKSEFWAIGTKFKNMLDKNK